MIIMPGARGKAEGLGCLVRYLPTWLAALNDRVIAPIVVVPSARSALQRQHRARVLIGRFYERYVSDLARFPDIGGVA